MRAAYRADSALDAQAQLTALARDLDKTHPSAAASLREDLAETLTVLAWTCHPPRPGPCARRTIESMISSRREHAKNVKHWQDGPMAMRWCAAGMIEATRQFRRVNGHLHVPALRAALERHVAERTVSPMRQDENANPA
jgi:putative transposase